MNITVDKIAYKLNVLRFVEFATIGFIVACVCAMLLFPTSDGKFGGYKFFQQFISALGMTRAHHNVDNIMSCLIFNISLGASMIALMFFWHLRMQFVFINQWFKSLASSCCFGFCLGVIVVAMTPYDRFPQIHNVAIYSSFGLIIPGLLIVMWGTDKAYSSFRYKFNWGLIFLLTFWGEAVLWVLVQEHVITSTLIFPVIQKINVLIFVSWLLIEIHTCRHCLMKQQNV